MLFLFIFLFVFLLDGWCLSLCVSVLWRRRPFPSKCIYFFRSSSFLLLQFYFPLKYTKLNIIFISAVVVVVGRLKRWGRKKKSQSEKSYNCWCIDSMWLGRHGVKRASKQKIILKFQNKNVDFRLVLFSIDNSFSCACAIAFWNMWLFLSLREWEWHRPFQRIYVQYFSFFFLFVLFFFFGISWKERKKLIYKFWFINCLIESEHHSPGNSNKNFLAIVLSGLFLCKQKVSKCFDNFFLMEKVEHRHWA